MKILFITPFVPSDKAGGEKFTKLVLEHLSLNHKIDLVYFKYTSDIDYTPPNKNIQVLKICHNSTLVKLRNAILYPFIHPLFSIRFSYPLLHFLKKKVKENQYNLLYLDHSQMALYGKFFPNIKKIYMSHDVMAQRYERSSNHLIRKLVLFSEGNLTHQPNIKIFTFSEKDKLILKSEYNVESYTTNFYLDNIILEATPTSIEKRLIFFGQWKRQDNFEGLKWFINNVSQKISKEFKISIIGGGLSRDFQDYIKKYENIEYLGFVNNPYNLISNSLAVISPLFSGAGVKVKVIESLACGTPVIGNNIAFEGISNKYNDFMLYAEKSEDYIYQINTLNISVAMRLRFKKFFLKSYQQQYISTFIDKL